MKNEPDDFFQHQIIAANLILKYSRSVKQKIKDTFTDVWPIFLAVFVMGVFSTIMATLIYLRHIGGIND